MTNESLQTAVVAYQLENQEFLFATLWPAEPEVEEGPCFDAVREAQIRQKFSGLMTVYIPTCNQDGSFTALQCGMCI